MCIHGAVLSNKLKHYWDGSELLSLRIYAIPNNFMEYFKASLHAARESSDKSRMLKISFVASSNSEFASMVEPRAKGSFSYCKWYFSINLYAKSLSRGLGELVLASSFQTLLTCENFATSISVKIFLIFPVSEETYL